MDHRDTQDTLIASDPFADPVTPALTERDLILKSTLAVNEQVTLTLGKEQLIVLDQEVQEQPKSKCGLHMPQKTTKTCSIPYFNILSATLSKSEITVRYAKPVSKKKPAKCSVTVQSLVFPLSSHEQAQKWTARLLTCAYGPAQRNKRIKVLINPFGGVGRAQKQYLKWAAPVFAAADCQVEVETTTHKGHATNIAEQLDINSYDVLCCASGDGLPYEVFNGLSHKPNAAEALRKVAVVQLPCGSGNAMSWNLNGTDDVSLAALSIVKGVRTPLDLASITQLSNPETRTISFLSQSIGIIAESDLGTDNIRWMGDLRFTLGFLVRLLGKTVYPIDIAVRTEIEDKSDIKQHYADHMLRRQRLDIGSAEILDKELEALTGLGLPPLKYGNVSEPLKNVANDPSMPKLDGGWSPLTPYLNLGNFYSGNMCYMAADTPFFPASLPNDGNLDLVTIDGDISRLRAIGLLLDVGGGRIIDQDIVRYRKITAVRVVPKFGWPGAYARQGSTQQAVKKSFFARLITRLTGGGTGEGQKEGYFSVDGERLPFEPFQVEVHRGLGTVLSHRWGVYEFESGPHGWEDLALAKHDAGANTTDTSVSNELAC